jgi:hypothetical protein
VANGKRDVLIHYDEEKQTVILYTVDVNDTKVIREKEFDGVRPDVQFFRDKSADEAERVLGSMVFAAIDLSAGAKIGIRDYAAEAAASIAEYVADLESRAATNDAEAQYYLSLEYHSRALRETNRELLQKADRLIRAAAAAGNAEAQASLDRDWPFMLEVAERRMKRGPAV